MWNQNPCFRFEIDNFSEKEGALTSQIFVSGGCEWYLKVHPKGNRVADGHLSLYLYVAHPNWLPTGWKRSARFYFVVLNQSNKELYISSMEHSRSLFCAKTPAFGFSKTMPLSKFQEKGDKDTLFIEVYIDIDEAIHVDGEGRSVLETVDINDFQVLASQAASVRKIFAEHPEFAKDFKPKNKVVKTEYMNVLLDLIETLEKPQNSLSKSKRSKACSDLTELMDAGFKLDWLKSKLGEVSLDQKKTSDPDVSRVQKLEERVKNLELLESSFKLDSLNAKLEEISLEREKADDDWSRVSKLEESVKDLEWSRVSMNSLNARLEDVSEERMVVYKAVESRVKQLEASVKNLEMMVSNLTVELDKEKAESPEDEFLLVDNVD